MPEGIHTFIIDNTPFPSSLLTESKEEHSIYISNSISYNYVWDSTFRTIMFTLALILFFLLVSNIMVFVLLNSLNKAVKRKKKLIQSYKEDTS